MIRWKFDIVDLIVVCVVSVIFGWTCRHKITFVTESTSLGFSSPSSEASAGAGPKAGPESGDNGFNAGETKPSRSTENQQLSLSGHLIRKAAERNSCYGDDYLILLAIRKAENGGPGKEFGVEGKAWGTNLETQAAWAAATIVKTKERWERAGRPTDFLGFLARRYCPLNNETWERNVRFWFRRFKK